MLHQKEGAHGGLLSTQVEVPAVNSGLDVVVPVVATPFFLVTNRAGMAAADRKWKSTASDRI